MKIDTMIPNKNIGGGININNQPPSLQVTLSIKSNLQPSKKQGKNIK